MSEERLSDEEARELNRLYAESRERHRLTVWFNKYHGPNQGWYMEIIQRDEIDVVTLLGPYAYNALYQVRFTDGRIENYKIDYHTIKESALEWKNSWAIPLFEAIEPLNKALYEINLVKHD